MGILLALVPEYHVAFVERFGKFDRVARPGLHWLNPCKMECITRPISLELQEHPLVVETRTKDNVFVTIKAAVRLRVVRSALDFPLKEHAATMREALPHELMSPDQLWYQAYYTVDDPIKQMKSSSEEYLRVHVMSYTMDHLFTIKDELTASLQSRLNEEMNPYGYVVTRVVLGDIDPDHSVKRAMNDIVIAEKSKQTQVFTADAHGQVAVIQARADAQVQQLEGEGIARHRQAIAMGLRESIAAVQEAVPGADASLALRAIMMSQYMDVLRVGAETGRNTYVLPSTPAHASSIEEQLRTVMMARLPTPGAAAEASLHDGTPAGAPPTSGATRGGEIGSGVGRGVNSGGSSPPLDAQDREWVRAGAPATR